MVLVYINHFIYLFIFLQATLRQVPYVAALWPPVYLYALYGLLSFHERLSARMMCWQGLPLPRREQIARKWGFCVTEKEGAEQGPTVPLSHPTAQTISFGQGRMGSRSAPHSQVQNQDYVSNLGTIYSVLCYQSKKASVKFCHSR